MRWSTFNGPGPSATTAILTLPRVKKCQQSFQYHVEPSPVPLQAPVVIRNDSDPVNDDLMRHLAADMGDEWQKVAMTLNISRARIQAILRNTQISDSTDEDARYQMLITWLKKMPKSIDKVRQQDNKSIYLKVWPNQCCAQQGKCKQGKCTPTA